MDELFNASIEAFPTYDKAFLSFNSMMDGDDTYYEMEVPREETSLTSLFKRLHILCTPETPCTTFTQFSRDVLNKNVGTFYTKKSDLSNVINSFRSNAPDPNKVPGKPVDDPINMFITESFTLKDPILINNKIIPKGKKIYFYYEGVI